ncbi:metallophosphoesterase family protein [Marinobacterium litorale]|uniref:metallophosphoesterase family protein n=1 Tax=Marinobacterium litorale TaxID=404770 RepID=UPI0003F83B1C|nr:metallophosphoesterase [Marinobacterium litorale]
MRIVQLSDPHFGTERADVLELLLVSVETLAPELIVLSGDVTQRATEEQFWRAAHFMARLPKVPKLVVPGNHDIPLFNLWRRLVRPYERFERMLGCGLEPTITLGSVQLVGFNSAPRWRHRHGQLSRSRLTERLAVLPPSPGLRVAVFHHPLDCRRHQDRENVLKGAQQILPVLADKQVDLVLSGHIHDPMTRTSEHLYPALSPRVIIGLAGTCVSERTRLGAPNSFQYLELDADQQTILAERWDLDSASALFQPVQAKSFSKDASGWREDGSVRPYRSYRHYHRGSGS